MNFKNKNTYAWVVVGLLWVVALLNYMDRQMLSTMKVAMMGDIKELESAENFGRLMAVFLWIYALMSSISGLIADRLNRKWLIVGIRRGARFFRLEHDADPMPGDRQALPGYGVWHSRYSG